MAGKFELKKSKKGQFMFNLKASNGQVILSSEQYLEKTGAEDGIESVRKNAGDDANYEAKTSNKNQPFFVLKAANGQIIGKSEMYSTVSAMRKGMNSVKANAPTAKVTDLTA